MGGVCASGGLSMAEKQASEQKKSLTKSLDQHLRAGEGKQSKVVKLLLLGTGESGKSTIFKQMQILYSGVGDGFTDYEKQTYRHVVRRNVVESMHVLLQGAARFGYRLASEEADKAAANLLQFDPLAAHFWRPEVVAYVQTLWLRDPAIRKAYDNRSRLQLADSAEYLFQNIERIGRDDYIPTKEDILRARLRTSGIVEKTFKIKDVNFKFMDVGGQRNERRKWIHCFEGVTAVIFVAAISEYDQVLYEDSKENRLKEALAVFNKICNNRFFKKTAMILFLNKIDLFREKVTRVPLNDCFPEYKGDNSYEDASQYIKAQFFEQSECARDSQDLYAHFTCATDTNLIERVFDICRKVILKRNLEKLGLA